MKNQEIRLEGAYNDQSFQIAHQNGVEDITLDFRPRSFNFIPIHHCEELLATWKHKFKKFHLLFSEDSELVVNEIYSKIKTLAGDKVDLEFEYYRENFNYKEVNLPFSLWVEELDQIERAILEPNLEGLIFNNNFLKDLEEEGILSDYLTYIHGLILSNQRLDLTFSLKIDWDETPISSFQKWFKVNQYIVSISKAVEERYRVIHQEVFMDKLNNVHTNLKSVERNI